MSQAITFERPPVSEVAFSVSFSRHSSLLTAHVGLFWQRVRAAFPRIEDHPPLPLVQAPKFVDGVPQLQVQFDVTDLPPLRRTWFVSDDERRLIQLQDDRLVFNWRRRSAEDEYPRYAVLRPIFDDVWATFLKFLAEAGISPPNLTALELLYVNQIDASNGMNVAGLAAALVDHQRDSGRERFLPPPLAGNTMSMYELPDQSGVLNVTSQGHRKGLRIDMLARGLPPGSTPETLGPWWDLAHEWIVSGFKDATVAQLHDAAWKHVR